MIHPTDLSCPVCAVALDGTSALTCPRCARTFAPENDILDLRAHPERIADGSPLTASELVHATEAARRTTFKAALEELLLRMPEGRADHTMQLLREARAAWFLLLGASRGRLLFLGNALSGAWSPLARAGFDVTVLEPSLERLCFARERARAAEANGVRWLRGGDGERLPFVDRAFDVVVQADGLPRRSNFFRHEIDECLRVCAGEIVLTADNRLAYKRSSGRRSDFRVATPIGFALRGLRPPSGEKTLFGYRRLLSPPGFVRPRAFALYPDARDFSHVVALEAPLPGLTIGPMERKNRLKLAARGAGLFPVLTPSFVLMGRRAGDAPRAPRIDRILAELADRIGEPTPAADQIVATRGNTAVVHTRLGDARGPDSNRVAARGAAGRWTLHIGLSPKNVPQFRRHFDCLGTLRTRFPNVPVPEPLFAGVIDGIELTCERRARGVSAPQICGHRVRVARMLADVARHFAELVVRPAEPLSEVDFDEQVTQRIELVARHAAVSTTITELWRMRDEMRERLIGRPMPLVLYHADLRAKHVQVDEDGAVNAYLDWGTAEPRGLPYFDLLHLVVHERKQEEQLSAGSAWRLVRDRARLRDEETLALDSYCRAVGLDEDGARAIEALYPVLVAAMAEKNWDYSRPRWLSRQFGV